MNIIVVEDKIAEVSGYLQAFKSNGWGYNRFKTFSEVYTSLVEQKELVDLFFIDIMLPWGDNVAEEVAARINWMKAGLYLIYAIRDIKNDKLEEIRTKSKLEEELPKEYKDIPVIALTKVLDSVEDELSKIPNVFSVRKVGGTSAGEAFTSFVRDVCSR